MILWVVDLHRRMLILPSVLQMRSLHRSWDFEIDVHFGGSRHLDFENGCGESKSVGFVVGFAIGGAVNEIGRFGPSVRRNGQTVVIQEWS